MQDATLAEQKSAATSPEPTLTSASPVTNNTALVDPADHHQNPFASVGPARKIALTVVFSLATAIDVLNISSLITATASIAADLDLDAGNVTWM
jgi:hypothetical protein